MTTPSALSWFACPSQVHLGVGAHVQIGAIVRELQCSRLFIAIDAALVDSDLHRRITALLDQQAVQTALFTGIEPDPSADTVERAFAVAQGLGAQAVLAIGGGSTIDVAKAVAILATNGGRIHDYEGIDKFTQRPLPRIALPTTAGTGSEVSGSCVITDTERQLKMSIRHARLNPADHAILDPMALCTMPAHVAAHAGLDAFVHALESYVSRLANPVTDALNLHAIELLSANLRRFVADRSDLEAGLAMLCGSTLAGMSFGITGLGNVHCMARFVGTALHVSHGLSNALCLPVVAAFNLEAAPHKFARVAQAMGCRVEGLDDRARAESAVAAITALCADLGIPARLRDAGAREEDLPALARQCAEAGYNKWNPRASTVEDFLGLFRRAW